MKDPKARILVLVADRLQRDWVVLTLRRAGYEVQACTQPPEAEEVLRKSRPALLLVDSYLPGWDAFAWLEQWREAGRLTGAGVVVLSALAFAPVVRRSAQLGALDFIVKPTTSDILCQRVERALMKVGAPFDSINVPWEAHETNFQTQGSKVYEPGEF